MDTKTWFRAECVACVTQIIQDRYGNFLYNVILNGGHTVAMAFSIKEEAEASWANVLSAVAPDSNGSANTVFDLISHLHRQIAWSHKTFGPGNRTAGVIDHIRKELKEIEENDDLEEWIDVAILAFDGAWRSGFSAESIIAALRSKQLKNEKRTWPDWRTAPLDKAIEHERS